MSFECFPSENVMRLNSPKAFSEGLLRSLAPRSLLFHSASPFCFSSHPFLRLGLIEANVNGVFNI